MTKNAPTNDTPVVTENSPEANGRVGLLTFKKTSIYKFFWIIYMLNNMMSTHEKLPCQFQCQTADSALLHKYSCIQRRLKPVYEQSEVSSENGMYNSKREGIYVL
jgi:hypothetical protein